MELLDPGLLIIRIRRDTAKLWNGAASVAPSPVIDEVKLTGAPGLNEAVNQRLVRKGAWHLATVMTCSPSAPNDLRRMYEVQVSIGEAATTAGVAAPGSNGSPDQELRSHLAEARVAWQDDLALIITTGPFGLSGGSLAGKSSGIGADEPVQQLTPVNLKQELEPLAKAIAAADLLSKLDRHEGSLAVPMSASLVPIGSIGRVVHRVMEGRAVSVLLADAPGPSWNAIDFLPASARKFLLREVQSSRRGSGGQVVGYS